MDEAEVKRLAEVGLDPAGKPIPFKPKIRPAPDGKSNPPTSLEDCQRNGGHGGPKGNRVYHANGKLGKLLGEPRICEICGEVDV